jgi:hypothetical protein
MKLWLSTKPIKKFWQKLNITSTCLKIEIPSRNKVVHSHLAIVLRQVPLPSMVALLLI